jgi:hypothetical protein
MARKTLAAELAEFKEFFEENKGIEIQGAVRQEPNVYRVTTHNSAFTVTVSREAGMITEAIISYPQS